MADRLCSLLLWRPIMASVKEKPDIREIGRACLILVANFLGFVLQNYGYEGMGHNCAGPCTKDWDCVHAKLAGKPHNGC
jgi:hypothetical protein